MPASLKVFTKGACRRGGAQLSQVGGPTQPGCRPFAATADSIGLTGIEFINPADGLPRPESSPPVQHKTRQREMT